MRARLDQQYALCVFDDIIQFCGAESYKYHELFLEHMMAGLQNADAGIRQVRAWDCASQLPPSHKSFSHTRLLFPHTFLDRPAPMAWG